MPKKIKRSKKNSNRITTRNHYVPVWYQKRFLNKQTQYWCLDKLSEKDPYLNVPKNNLLQSNLYTIDLFGKKSDVIERELFGEIDFRGSQSIDIIAVKDGWNKKGAHEGWQDFMQFMNAQKLRTPKGLDWIRNNLTELGYDLKALGNMAVLEVMQKIRHLYCSMWTEAGSVHLAV